MKPVTCEACLSEKNPELKDVFENVDFVQFTTSRENVEILRQLVELFSAKPLHHVSPDILAMPMSGFYGILLLRKPKKVKFTLRER